MRKGVLKINKKISLVISTLVLIGLMMFVTSKILAEINSGSPESNIDSNSIKIYNSLVDLGYGSDEDGGLGNALLNRIKTASEWVPTGTATDEDFRYGKTFYSNSRELKTSSATLGRIPVQKYYLVTSLPSFIITSASGGTAASVTDNGITRTLSNNNVTYDRNTKLYWSYYVTNSLDNESVYINGEDRVNPTGASCNFNSPGTANQYCDNQDPLNLFAQDNDVSAAEFCLNLSLDSDNADGDNNGLTGAESDWRLPTQKEVNQLFLDGESTGMMVNSTECTIGQQYMNMGYCIANAGMMRNANVSVRCVRRNP